MAFESGPVNERGWRLGAPWLIIGAVLLVYGQTLGHGFINFDDPVYITDNPQVLRGLSWEGVKWAFGAGLTGMWQPFTWLSLMANVEYLGAGAVGFHAVNVALHAGNALVLYALLLSATAGVGRSLLVALLFAVHPLNVETVAWASQRKSTLSLLFGLLAIWAWIHYLRRGSRPAYVLAWFAFLAGLLAKPMLVPLPFLLLLLGIWLEPKPLVSWRERMLVLVPFGVLALGFAWICLSPVGPTDVAQGGALMTWASTLNVPPNIVAYLGRSVWPVDLAVLYPRAELWSVAATVSSLLVLAAGGWLAWRGTRGAAWRFGFAWFLGALLPVSGLVIIGPHAVADRYFYLPGIGLFIALAWSLPWRPVWIAGAALAVVSFGALAFAQVGLWRDSATLWSYTAKVTMENPTQLVNLGAALVEAGRDEAAVSVLLRAQQLSPKEHRSWLNLAMILDRRGEKSRALAMLDEAARIAPADARIHNHRGSLLHDLGRLEEAGVALRQAITLKPEYAEPWVNLGVIHAGEGDLPAAIAAFERAVAINPHLDSARQNLVLARRSLAERAVK